MRVLKILTVMSVLFCFASIALQAAEIVVGMTKDKVIAVKGEPNRKDVVSATDELWYYADGDLQVGIMGGKVIYVQQGDKPAVTAQETSTWNDPVTGMEFVWVPGGTFQMGCGTWLSDCQDDEKPVHEVNVNGVWMAKTEVTVGQFRKFVEVTGYRTEAETSGKGCIVVDRKELKEQAGKNWRDPGLKQDDSHPVVCVSWNDAKKLAEWLSDKGNGHFRLPTEVEWEYACRSGGKPEKYCGSSEIEQVAWHRGNSGNTTHSVGQKVPNGLGIYDMSGNVFEWTCSDNADYNDGGKNHAKCSSGGSSRVSRGGGWFFSPDYVRSAARSNVNPGYRNFSSGFRLARTDR
ncbi:MAG: SUMF1/EgtB/PvdO family nonheme iron enzyme [Magnetococcus sp. YQC-3]